MEHNVFEKPVRVLSGLGLTREITTAFQAYTFLSELPGYGGRHDHAIARRTCFAAMNGAVDAETARAAFVTFARRAGMLVPEVDDVVAASATSSVTSRATA